jgi:hypothetical protein
MPSYGRSPSTLTGDNEVLGLGQDSGFVFGTRQLISLPLEDFLHEEVKESFKAFVVYQASLVLFPASIFRFKCFCLQYVFTYIIGITSTLAPYPSAPSLVAYMTQK